MGQDTQIEEFGGHIGGTGGGVLIGGDTNIGDGGSWFIDGGTVVD